VSGALTSAAGGVSATVEAGALVMLGVVVVGFVVWLMLPDATKAAIKTSAKGAVLAVAHV